MQYVNVDKFKWTYFNHNISFRASTYRHKHQDIKGLTWVGFTNYRVQEFLSQEGNYAILKRASYSYRSGNGYAASNIFVGTEYSLCKLTSGSFESTGTVDVLFRGSFGNNWRKGIEELKYVTQKLIEFDSKGEATDDSLIEFLKSTLSNTEKVT